MNLQRDTQLSDVLYYDTTDKEKNKLKKRLTEYQFLLNVFTQALTSFEEKEYEKFDSLVGDNACQIRALKIAILGSKDFSDLELKKTEAREMSEKINALLDSPQLNKLAHLELSLKESLIKEFFLDSELKKNLKTLPPPVFK